MLEIIAPHSVDVSTDYFKSVEKIALKKGFVKIRCIPDGNTFIAMEGSHRLAIANKHKNIKIIIKKIKLLNRIVRWSDFDGGDCSNLLKMFETVIASNYCNEKTYIFDSENIKIT